MAKSKYETHILPHFAQIEAWARDGVPERDMYTTLKVGKSTWEDYKRRYPDFQDLLARTKNYIDLVEMVGAYKRRAEGYTVTEYKREYKYIYDHGKRVRVLDKETEYERHVPGDPRAMENWLRLRQKETWGDMPVVEGDGSGVVMMPARIVPTPPKEGDEHG